LPARWPLRAIAASRAPQLQKALPFRLPAPGGTRRFDEADSPWLGWKTPLSWRRRQRERVRRRAAAAPRTVPRVAAKRVPMWRSPAWRDTLRQQPPGRKRPQAGQTPRVSMATRAPRRHDWGAIAVPPVPLRKSCVSRQIRATCPRNEAPGRPQAGTTVLRQGRWFAGPGISGQWPGVRGRVQRAVGSG